MNPRWSLQEAGAGSERQAAARAGTVGDSVGAVGRGQQAPKASGPGANAPASPERSDGARREDYGWG
jgi:hypothetical protein